jgi:hypothetical protein
MASNYGVPFHARSGSAIKDASANATWQVDYFEDTASHLPAVTNSTSTTRLKIS